MDKKTMLKVQKQMLKVWFVLSYVSLVIIFLTILSLTHILNIGFNSVTGILVPVCVLIASAVQIAAYYKENTMHYLVATSDDKKEILAVYEAAKVAMAEAGIDQWDDIYPDMSDVTGDIKDKTLTKVVMNNKIVGVYVINKKQDPSYNFGTFTDTSDSYVILHRLCIHPRYQQLGYAAKILSHLEEQAKKDGASSIRLDVFTKNPRAMKLYEKAGYTYAGDAYYRKGKFNLMEKIL